MKNRVVSPNWNESHCKLDSYPSFHCSSRDTYTDRRSVDLSPRLNTIDLALYLEFKETLAMQSAAPTQIKSPKLRCAYQPTNRLAGANKIDCRPQLNIPYDDKATVESVKFAHGRDNNALKLSGLGQDHQGFNNREHLCEPCLLWQDRNG